MHAETANKTVSCFILSTILWSDAMTEIDASLVLRRHFCSRTNELLVPLSRYLNSLIPPPAEINGPKNPRPRLKPFHSQNFMASLKAHGSPLPFRSTSKKIEFYERWLFLPSKSVLCLTVLQMDQDSELSSMACS